MEQDINLNSQLETVDGEQPQDKDFTLNVEEQQNETETLSGSPLGKFKSVDALKNAYENLEKEFTIKCQKVKELSDKLDENSDNTPQGVPEYKQDGWEQKVKNFFASFPQAKQYAAEISDVLSSDEKIATGENSLENALTKVLASKFMPYPTLIKNQNFLDNYVLNNNEISEKVIENYLEKIASKKTLPLISSLGGSGTYISPLKKPQSLKEASKMAEDYFKN